MARFPGPAAGPFALALLAVTPPGAAAAPPSASAYPSYATRDETIAGTIASISGKYALTVEDVRGFIDSITLHDGTLIVPRGITLEVGQEVRISGRTDGSTFDADEIDTDGADFDAASAGGYSAAALEDVYPAYVVPLGGGAYYYGTSCCYGGAGPSGFYYGTNAPPSGPVTPSTPVSRRPAPISHPPIGHAPTGGSRPSGGGSHASRR